MFDSSGDLRASASRHLAAVQGEGILRLIEQPFNGDHFLISKFIDFRQVIFWMPLLQVLGGFCRPPLGRQMNRQSLGGFRN